MDRITEILRAVEAGDSEVAELLFPAVYDELRQLAQSKMAKQTPGNTLQATALVHEVWMKFDQAAPQTWKNRRHFFVTASKAMGQILMDRAKRKLSQKRGGGAEHVAADLIEIESPAKAANLVLMETALEEFRWHAPDKADVVYLRFFVGFGDQEIAEILDVSERTIGRHWVYAKTWLFNRIEEMKSE